MTRVEVIKAAVWANDRSLALEAVKQSAHYRELSTSVRRDILAIAANASPAIADRLRAEALVEQDPALRQDLYQAIGSVRDAKRHRAMLDVILEPKTTADDIVSVLTASSGEVGRDETERWLREHLAEVAARLPSGANEDFPYIVYVAALFTNACDGARRDEIADYVTKHFGSLPSAERPVRQMIEVMDQCIAQRALLEPSLRAWLGVK